MFSEPFAATMQVPFRVVSLVFFITALTHTTRAQDFFDDDLDSDTDLITIHHHDHDESDGHDLDLHEAHVQDGTSHGVHSLKAAGLFLQTSAGQAEHCGASNEHIDRGHDHIRLDGDEIKSDQDTLTSNEAPAASSIDGVVLGADGLPIRHVPDLTNHALAAHAQYTGLHGMETPSVLTPIT